MMYSVFITMMMYWLSWFWRMSENPCGTMMPRVGEEDWGIGAYVIPDEFEAFVYSDTNGTVVGRLEVMSYGLWFYDIFKRRVIIESGDIEWIGHYSHELLKVNKSGSPFYLRTLAHTGAELFLDKRELDSLGWEFYTFKDLLFSYDLNKVSGYEAGVKIGVNLRKTCLNLRSGPSVDSAVIACIYGNLGQEEGESHLKILDHKGDWAKVIMEIKVFQEGDGDCPTKLKRTETGWVKAIAANGFPNIWYAVSSY